MMKEEIIPHPYTYKPTRAVKENGLVRWFDLHTNEELPPFFGYGVEAQAKVDHWYDQRRNEK